MKKLLFAVVLLASVALCFANAIQGSRVGFARHIAHSFNDYMHGGYKGMPIRLQTEEQGGLYMTFMRNSTVAGNRRQYWFHAWQDGRSERDHAQLTDRPGVEGFGTLAIDQRTGSPFFVWHADYVAEVENRQNVHMRVDWFHLEHMPGMPSPIGMIVDNSAHDPEESLRYIWPVAHIGESPLANHQRLFVFTSNAEPARFVSAGQSGSVQLSFADFSDNDLLAPGFPDNLNWTHRPIPYFHRIHNWEPPEDEDNQHLTFARGVPAYAVSGRYVAIAGSFAGNPEPTGHGPHDTFVLFNDNYGEGEFREYTFMLQRNLESGPVAMENDERVYAYDPNRFDHYRLIRASLGNKTALIDARGRVQFPAIYRLFWFDIDANPETETRGYGNIYMHSVNNIVFDPAAPDELVVHHIMPRSPQGSSNQIAIPWDFDEDGFVDNPVFGNVPQGPEPDAGRRRLNEFFPGDVYPYFFGGYERDARPTSADLANYSGMRLTSDNNGLIAMVWMDGAKSLIYNTHKHNPGAFPEYAEYEEVPEMMIVISLDSGDNWSEPYRISRLTHPDLTNTANPRIMSYVWPADKLVRRGPNTVRLYFMYFDDHSYGSFTVSTVPDFTGGPHGTNIGGDIRFAAMDFDVSDLVSSKEVAVVRPQPMLAQNFPNPFNPNTTINFSISSTSEVNLSVFNIRGQHVRTLKSGVYTAGNHSVVWDGTDSSNRGVSSGIYFYRLEAGDRTEVRRMLLMK